MGRKSFNMPEGNFDPVHYILQRYNGRVVASYHLEKFIKEHNIRSVLHFGSDYLDLAKNISPIVSEYVGIENALMLKRQSSLEVHAHSDYDFFAKHECSKTGYDLILFTHVFGGHTETDKKMLDSAMKHSRINSRIVVIEHFTDTHSNYRYNDFSKIAGWVRLQLLQKTVAMYLLPYTRQSEAVESFHLHSMLTADNLYELTFALYTFSEMNHYYPLHEPERLRDIIAKLNKMDLYKKARSQYAMPIVDTMLIL